MPVPRGFPLGQSRLHRESATKICVCVFVYVASFFSPCVAIISDAV